MKPILLLIYAFSYVIPSCAFSSISAKSSVRTDIFLRATSAGIDAIVAENDDDSKKKTFYEKELTLEIRSSSYEDIEELVDIAIIGAGIGGLCAGAILNTLYNKKVGIYESHYLPGERNLSFSAYHMLKLLYTHIMCMQLM